MARAIIIGCNGQDGRILWDQLAALGFSLLGLARTATRASHGASPGPVDLADAAAVLRLVGDFRPDHIYFLAAHHHSSQDRTDEDGALWTASWHVHVQAFQHFLQAIKAGHPTARIFYASSSRIFGQAAVAPQTESTPVRPTCVYGATKAAGMMLADYYRRNHGLHAACGILFNHESPLRGPQFLSQRVVHGVVALKTGRLARLEIGSLDSQVDWGYAMDYTRAMRLILEADLPDDFVVASGELHSVRDMIEIAAEIVGLDWRPLVVENAQILRRPPLPLRGDASRLRRVTGWRPDVDFRGLVEIMTRAALARANETS